MSNLSFRDLAGAVKTRVDADLDAFFAREIARARDAQATELVRTLEASRVMSMRGGKRVRPAFVALGYRVAREALGLSFDDLAPVAPGLVAFELLQSYLLAHDDWMDGDDERRGGPSLHAALGRELGSAQDGAVLAILAGDWMHSASYTALTACGVDAPALGESVKQFATIGREVVRGQVEDVRRAPRTRAAVEELHRAKTGSYTVEGPLVLGLALGGLPLGDAKGTNGHPVVRAIRAYADPLGLAFQLKDDLLGAFGDPAVTGKPSGADLREGKASAVTIAIWEKAAAPVRTLLDRVLAGGTRLDDEEIRAVHAEADRLGTRAELNARLTELLDQANRALADANVREDTRRLLNEAGRAMVDRDK